MFLSQTQLMAPVMCAGGWTRLTVEMQKSLAELSEHWTKDSVHMRLLVGTEWESKAFIPLSSVFLSSRCNIIFLRYSRATQMSWILSESPTQSSSLLAYQDAVQLAMLTSLLSLNITWNLTIAASQMFSLITLALYFFVNLNTWMWYMADY